jgi:hypothetical protein
MKTIKPVEQATDSQLRKLAERFHWMAEHKGILQSQLPMLTVERAQIVGLLKINHIHQFAH